MSKPYVLLSQQAQLPRQPKLYKQITCYELAEVLSPFTGDTALDFETSGLDPFQENQRIRSVALANNEACVAIDLASLGGPALNYFWWWAKSHPGFLLHNATFDALWARTHGQGIKVAYCTATLFRHLSTEGWAGQSWSLKTAMTDILGWPEKNNLDLMDWLKENKLKAGDMHLAPWEILGTYNALDADATWQLWAYLMQVIDTKLPAELANTLLDYHKNDVINEINLTVEQQISGMVINVAKLELYEKKLEGLVHAELLKFLQHGQIAPILEEVRQYQLDELMSVHIEQFTKTGAVAKRWEARQEKYQQMLNAPIHEIFNVDSPKQLSWLFYDKLKYKVQRETEKGEPSVDNKSLPYFGEPGKILQSYRKLRDRLKFVVATKNVQVNGILHPSITISGTVTGRIAGGNQG